MQQRLLRSFLLNMFVVASVMVGMSDTLNVKPDSPVLVRVKRLLDLLRFSGEALVQLVAGFRTGQAYEIERGMAPNGVVEAVDIAGNGLLTLVTACMGLGANCGSGLGQDSGGDV